MLIPLSVLTERDPRPGHLFSTELGWHVLVSEGSRVYTVTDDFRKAWQAAPDERHRESLLAEANVGPVPLAVEADDNLPPLRALSLAVAQKCNLACTYCYAEQGDFGGAPKNMPLDHALRAVDRLFQNAALGDTVNLSFLGGEPLLNRPVLRAAARHAAQAAQDKGVHLNLSVTTNGTLVTPEDGEFFEEHGFAVTVSLDGVGRIHDSQRPFRGGEGSYECIIQRIEPLLRMQRRMQVSARMTATPESSGGLKASVDSLIQLGFHSVGVSPLLTSPSGRNEMNAEGLASLLDEMKACGRAFERAVLRGARYPFLNAMNAMKEIHRGTHRPHPCGAGGAYFGVSAEGKLYACHRFVDDPSAEFGSIEDGVDMERQRLWLRQRHVEQQSPCRTCWARYLCGGGCHHEVLRRGRPGCDYIRGWLEYCLGAYMRIKSFQPGYFGAAS